MKSCPNCSTSNNDDMKFCPSCGTNLQCDLEKFLEANGILHLLSLMNTNDITSLEILEELDDSDLGEMGLAYGDKVRVKKAIESLKGQKRQTSNVLQSQKPQNSKAENARSYTVDGVYLGMTERDFAKTFPVFSPLQDLTDVEKNIKGVRVDKTQNTDGVDAAFYEGRLFSFVIWYSSKRINEIGGITEGYKVIMNGLIEKFGKPGEGSKVNNKEAQLVWTIEEASFQLKMLIRTSSILLNAIDMQTVVKSMLSNP